MGSGAVSLRTTMVSGLNSLIVPDVVVVLPPVVVVTDVCPKAMEPHASVAARNATLLILNKLLCFISFCFVFSPRLGGSAQQGMNRRRFGLWLHPASHRGAYPIYPKHE